MVARVPVNFRSFFEKSRLKNEVNCGKPKSEKTGQSAAKPRKIISYLMGKVQRLSRKGVLSKKLEGKRLAPKILYNITEMR